MKNRILPFLLLALLAATCARAQQHDYLRGNDTGSQCSFDGTQSPVGWATTSGGAKVYDGPSSDPTGIYHADGYLVRIDRGSAGKGDESVSVLKAYASVPSAEGDGRAEEGKRECKEKQNCRKTPCVSHSSRFPSSMVLNS